MPNTAFIFVNVVTWLYWSQRYCASFCLCRGDIVCLEQVHYISVSGLKDLVADLNPVVSRWYDLGVQLGIDDGELTNISGEGGRAQSCFREMLTEWMRNQTPTCRAIINALRSPAVQHCALASELERTKGSFLP